ncbi:hypothetical protein [Roseateles sp. LKC17W]|uniref:Uncharacterized protein n=1 Tax=Pelomonas margarita TaxID=3299031 RepID=A0ABW7FFK9_9BURK
MGEQKRSAASAADNLELWPHLDGEHSAAVEAPRQGVGGRQASRRPPTGGGGYLDGRSPSKVAGPVFDGSLSLADPLMLELAEIGLSTMWLGVAQFLGYERFLGFWRHLSAEPRALTGDGQILVELRDFASYERYQSNLYIRALRAAGLPCSVIWATVRAHLGDERSQRAITKITSDSWAESHMAARNAPQVSSIVVAQIQQSASSGGDLFPRELEHALLADACLKATPAADVPARDPRIAELIDIGMSELWINVAHLIGYDDFVALWAAWSAEPSLRGRSNAIELRLRTIRAFEKYQRNRYIETLVAAGLKPSQIYTMLQTKLGESMSFRHLKRLTNKAKVLG